ncbi:DUF6114 domain-containing protein [Streptomyces sp. MI02-7b]|uniref:DUF6114 domain-containing protein n=1 Tax=Streptomyces sp. MI02-7b TaxID=462941 RepID=UPI0029A3DB2C|nr:DUF6114 domain-containing protein [Streptomyces sp. MI02-7b]MDX3073574.1 DUF6114 domain-containing protein [Streptomyces sp. MI02-7b]
MIPPRKIRSRFRLWRRSRPFWAGFWTLLAGLEILSIPLAPLSLMIHEGIAGVSGLLMGVFLIVLGLTMWFAPHYRTFAGIATLVFSVASLVLSNFGGFLIGFLLGVAGGAMAVSWVPYGDGNGRWGRGRPVPDWGGGGGGAGPAHDPEAPREPDAPAAPGAPGGDLPEPPPAAPPAAPPAGPQPETSRGLRAGTVTRLRALSVIPVGGALLAGGLQPMAASAAHDHRAAEGPPSGASGASGESGAEATRRAHEAICGVLDGLYQARHPTVHGTGTAKEARAGLRLGVGLEAPLPVHGKLDIGPPAPRSAPHGPAAPLVPVPSQRRAAPVPPLSPSPSPSPSASPSSGGGGLLGAVSDLLGLRHAAPSAPPAPRAEGVPRRAAPQRGREARGSDPGKRRPQPPHVPTGILSGNKITPDSLLDLIVPRPPADRGMDAPLSLLPPRIRIGGGTPDSPWCLPQVSLELSIGAGRYRPPGLAAEQPFRVLTPLLVLTGLTYRGITGVPTRHGRERVLVFTAWRVDIANLRQTAGLLSPACARGRAENWTPPFHGLPGLALPMLDIGLPGIGHVSPEPAPWAPCQGELETDGRPWSTTTATGRPVVLLTRVLSGNLLGLLPVTFTPDMPPPLPPGLTIPIPLFFTQVVTYNQLLRANLLTIPGLHQYVSLPGR